MTRNNVQRQRDILIITEQWTEKIKQDALIAAAKQMKEGEYIVTITERSGHQVPWGSMDGEEVYYCNKVLVVGWIEPESDDEYFKRVKEDERRKHEAEEREKTTYLRLKAKYDGVEMVNGNLPSINEEAYTVTTEVVKHYHYNPAYGNDRECKCGHPYYRHFDTYENMSTVGCKYCECFHFEEATEEERLENERKENAR
jgi:hypothetical protein